MKKSYILLKDLPDAPKGGILNFSDITGNYVCCGKVNNKTIYVSYSPDVVENSPEWFKLKEEEKKVITNEYSAIRVGTNCHICDSFIPSPSLNNPPQICPNCIEALKIVVKDPFCGKAAPQNYKCLVCLKPLDKCTCGQDKEPEGETPQQFKTRLIEYLDGRIFSFNTTPQAILNNIFELIKNFE